MVRSSFASARILVAHIVGYSSIDCANEGGTLAKLRVLQVGWSSRSSAGAGPADVLLFRAPALRANGAVSVRCVRKPATRPCWRG